MHAFGFFLFFVLFFLFNTGCLICILPTFFSSLFCFFPFKGNSTYIVAFTTTVLWTLSKDTDCCIIVSSIMVLCIKFFVLKFWNNFFSLSIGWSGRRKLLPRQQLLKWPHFDNKLASYTGLLFSWDDTRPHHPAKKAGLGTRPTSMLSVQ